MSDTKAPDTLENFQVSTGEMTFNNGKPIKTTIVQWGPPEQRRRVEFRDITMSDQWKLARITGEDTSRQWRMMTLIALSMVQIDQLPLPSVGATINLGDVENRLDRLGEEGFEAVARASSPQATEADGNDAVDSEAAHRAQVGNLPATAASAA